MGLVARSWTLVNVALIGHVDYVISVYYNQSEVNAITVEYYRQKITPLN